MRKIEGGEGTRTPFPTTSSPGYLFSPITSRFPRSASGSRGSAFSSPSSSSPPLSFPLPLSPPSPPHNPLPPPPPPPSPRACSQASYWPRATILTLVIGFFQSETTEAYLTTGHYRCSTSNENPFIYIVSISSSLPSKCSEVTSSASCSKDELETG